MPDSPAETPPIDREAVVSRHNPEKETTAPGAPFQVGNGSFAVGVDETGLQTFEGTAANTLSDWGWHTAPPPDEGGPADFERTPVESHGRTLRYALPSDDQKALTEWLRANPHRINLGRIALRLPEGDDRSLTPETVDVRSQELDLWTGVVTSEFAVDGEPVTVETCCHPYRDVVAARVDSPLVRSGDLSVELAFPGPDPSYMAVDVGDWTRPDAHDTSMHREGDDAVRFERRLDDDSYDVALRWEGDASLERQSEHEYSLAPDDGSELAFVCGFSGDDESPLGEIAAFDQVRSASVEHWPAFWRAGAAVDLSESEDPRWETLEERVVRSQYVMAVNAAGSSPPQESGLASNTWYGKFHLEMILWHGMQFALWDRTYLLEGWLDWVLETGLPAARRNADRLGCAGARWQKMIDPSAEWQSPGGINPFRENQQGHAIYLMEELYRHRPSRETLERSSDVVFETAEYMADVVAWDPETERYVLGPPIVTGNEATDGLDSSNPTVELSYWAYGLETAQQWRERLGMERNEEWDEVLDGLAQPPTSDGTYSALESHPDQWEAGANPFRLQAYGCMPGTDIDPETMEATYERVVDTLEGWDLWGANFPTLAMTAARLGRPEEAIDLLLLDHPQNQYSVNGCNVMQDDDATVAEGAYLPGNGGVLWAVAMLVAGWDGAPDEHAPGFPDGWTVRAEGLHRTQ